MAEALLRSAPFDPLKKLLPFLLLGLIALVTPTKALDFDFNGTFLKDNDIGLASFTVGSTSSVTFFTSSWQAGGFDPILSLWNSSGDFLFAQDDSDYGGSAISNAVSYDYGVWDSYLSSFVLTPGTYTITVTQYGNSALGIHLGDGFAQDNNPHFTSGLGSADDFNGSLHDNDVRTGNWSLHITNVNPENHQSVPDASSTVVLIGLAMLALAGLRPRRS